MTENLITQMFCPLQTTTTSLIWLGWELKCIFDLHSLGKKLQVLMIEPYKNENYFCLVINFKDHLYLIFNFHGGGFITTTHPHLHF